MKIKVVVTDDNGKTYQGEIELSAEKQGKAQLNQNLQTRKKTWYKKGSTTEKIINLIEDGKFDEPMAIHDIIKALQTKDYHMKASDLTPGLRRLVRRNILKRSQPHVDPKPYKWRYTKI